MQRAYEIFGADGEVVESGERDMSWEDLRYARDNELARTDHWALADRELTDEQRDYRVMLRDLPSDFEGDNANDACNHWNANPNPEGA
jgi:hypothetical protein